MRGYISSTGIVAWPQPNVCTHRSAAMESAISSAARRIAESCVAWMSSITARVLSSQVSASISIELGWVSAVGQRGAAGGSEAAADDAEECGKQYQRDRYDRERPTQAIRGA